MAQFLIQDSTVCGFLEFEQDLEKNMDNLEYMCRFLDGISPEEPESTLRWDRLQVFHLTLATFLNSYGYDFQYTSEERVRDLLHRPRKSRILGNFVKLVDAHKLANQREFRKVFKIINEVR